MQVTAKQLNIIAYSLRSVDSEKIRPILSLCKKGSNNVNIPEKYRILIEDSLKAYKSTLSRLPTTKMNGKFILDTIAEIDTILSK